MASNEKIADICKAMSNTTLVNIDSKRQYRNLEFHEMQRVHRSEMEMRLTKLHSEIAATMRKTFEVFRADGADVLQQWRKYTMNMDVMIEEALRLNVKKSLVVCRVLTVLRPRKLFYCRSCREPSTATASRRPHPFSSWKSCWRTTRCSLCRLTSSSNTPPTHWRKIWRGLCPFCRASRRCC